MMYVSSNSNVAGDVAARILKDMPTQTALSAMTVLGMGPIVLSYPFFQRYIVKGITVGSVKE
jgi:putative aldouronate transport system permease protein